MNDRSKYLPLAATVAVCSLATLYWSQRNKKEKSIDSLSSDQCKVDLLPIEQTLAGGGGGDNAISTLTWFQGDTAKTSLLLKERVAVIVKANPWLAGRVRKHQGAYALVFDDKSPSLVDEYFHVTSDLISREVPLTELGAKLAHKLLKTGPTEPLWKVTIYPCSLNPTSQFAVVVSMSHVIGDGATFYKLQNMLLNASTTRKLESLLLDRITSTQDQQIRVLGGKAEYGILSSAGFIANCVKGVVKAALYKNQYTASSRIYMVDPEGMELAKKKAVFINDNDAPKFVSSNDVLTSWFFQNCNCQHGLMALNFRGRLEGHTDLHAGNYENVIFYRHEDSASPALIRKSISGQELYQRQVTASEPMPTFWQMVKASNAICSNWASFAEPCNLEGCKEEVQIPLYNVAGMLPSTMAICLVFRAGPQGLAVFVAGAHDKLEGLEKSVSFLKQDVVVS